MLCSELGATDVIMKPKSHVNNLLLMDGKVTGSDRYVEFQADQKDVTSAANFSVIDPRCWQDR